jgi:zinc and cadmium transporter
VDPVFAWIVVSGLAMSAIAMVGSVTLVLPERTLQGILLPLVAFAAGSLLGGAFFHMLPVGLGAGMSDVAVYGLVLAGFAVFFGLEQFLHWHHCHRADASCKKPLTYLILIGDGLHNFLGGLVHGGWEKGRALLYNMFSALTFLAGGLIAYAASFRLDVSFLVPFAAGNFIYIGAADLIPEVKAHAEPKANVVHFAAFALGVVLMLAVKLALKP